MLSRLGETSAEKGADTDKRVIEAYHMQCVAEAQEGNQHETVCLMKPRPFTPGLSAGVCVECACRSQNGQLDEGLQEI